MNEQWQMINKVALAFEMETSDCRMEAFESALRNSVADLLQRDFARLINILYRLDVDEEKLKKRLNGQCATDAAEMISKLIIERQLEKLQARWQQRNGEDIPEEDRW